MRQNFAPAQICSCSAGACLPEMYLAVWLFRLQIGYLKFKEFAKLFDTNALLIHIRSNLFFHPTATVPGRPLQLFSSTIISEFGWFGKAAYRSSTQPFEHDRFH